jgi:hypothetical protein
MEQYRKEAKRWLKAFRAGDPAALTRFRLAYPTGPSHPALRDVQHALARERGHENWVALTAAHGRPIQPDYERLAEDVMLAFNERDEAALQRVNDHYHRTFTFDDLCAEVWRRVYSFRQRTCGGTQAAVLERSEAETLIAQDEGLGSWQGLMEAKASGVRTSPAFMIDVIDNRIAPRRQLTNRDWDALVDAMRQQHIPGVESHGLMTDAVLAQIAHLDHVTSLGLEGSRQITDEGLQHLARMPQLERLNLTGVKVTDEGLEVLRHLPNLRELQMTWHRWSSDAGLANLRFCQRIERVDLMGSQCGDGVIEALQGKPALHTLHTGRLVTDAGLHRLQQFPALTRVLLDGPFTNDGLASLAALEQLIELDLFWHATHITSSGFAHLAKLPNLESIGADGPLSDDTAMRWYSRMTALRRLRAQETIATDAGFESLSQSKTLETIWTGQDAIALTDRGFVALSKMPHLQDLGVSCKDVSDAALSAFAQFPNLRRLTPIHVTDPGFAHIGRCSMLVDLSCMYCRDASDVATEHIAGLRLKKYYAGLTQITDRSLEIFGRMDSLEEFELYEVNGVTDAGLRALTNLPCLREVRLSHLPGVTWQGVRVFPASVHVVYAP